MTLVKVWHPDRFQNDPKLELAAEEKIKEINAAYDLLRGKVLVEVPRPATQPPRPLNEPEIPSASESDSMGAPDHEEGLKMRSRPKPLRKVMVAAGLISLSALLGISLDFFLSANPNTAASWGQFKAEISHDFHARGLSPADAAEVQASKSEGAPPAKRTQQGAIPAGTLEARNSSAAQAAITSEAANGVVPYVTSGLTTTEVLALLGTPTSSAGEKMFYTGSEIDFKNGRVAGWNIDRTAPIRVKLWPDAAPDPGVSTFAVGSSKSDVVAVQGTPTLFSDSRFGYGSSMVFFQNDRVTGWKEDPASVRLRAVAQ